MGGTGTKADKYRAQEKSCRVERWPGSREGAAHLCWGKIQKGDDIWAEF